VKSATLLWFWLHIYNSCHLLERACCIQEPKIGALKQHLRNQNRTLWKGGLVLESIILMPTCTPFILLKSQIADAAFTMYEYNYRINAWCAIVISTKRNSPNQKNAFRPLKRMCTVLWWHSTTGLPWKKQLQPTLTSAFPLMTQYESTNMTSKWIMLCELLQMSWWDV
jgi:hypothetical protein